MPLPWWAASILANFCLIGGMEYHYRHAGSGDFSDLLVKTWWIILLGQFFLFHAYGGAPHWMTAWVAFALGSTLVRLTLVRLYAPHEVVSWAYLLAGTFVMLAGATIVKKGLA